MKKLILWLFLIFSTLTYPMWHTEYERNKWNEKTGRAYISTSFYYEQLKLSGYDLGSQNTGDIILFKNYYNDVQKTFHVFSIVLRSAGRNLFYYIDSDKDKKIKIEFKIDSNEPIAFEGKFEGSNFIPGLLEAYTVSIIVFLHDFNPNTQKLFEQMKKGKQLKVLIEDQHLRVCNLDNFTKSFSGLNPGKYKVN